MKSRLDHWCLWPLDRDLTPTVIIPSQHLLIPFYFMNDKLRPSDFETVAQITHSRVHGPDENHSLFLCSPLFPCKQLVSLRNLQVLSWLFPLSSLPRHQSFFQFEESNPNTLSGVGHNTVKPFKYKLPLISFEPSY